MLSIVALFGITIIVMCAYGSADPPGLLRLVGRFSNRSGFMFAIAVRLVLGTVALLAAPESRAPALLNVIGVIALLAALVLPAMGLARYQRLIAWVSGFGAAALRTWLVFGLLFGVALVWASGFV